MNLTIDLREQYKDSKTGMIAGGISTFKDIKSLKFEYSPSKTKGYKLEIILFLGDKYNKQLITIDNIEKKIAINLASLLHEMAYNTGYVSVPDKEEEKKLNTKFEYPESYMHPEYFITSFFKFEERRIKDRVIFIYNGLDNVDVRILYENETQEEKYKIMKSGMFTCGKLKESTDDNPGNPWLETWDEEAAKKNKLLMHYLRSTDIECLVKHSRVWKIVGSKINQISDIIHNNKMNRVYVIELKPDESIEDNWDLYIENFKIYIDKLKKYNSGNVGIDFKSSNISEDYGKTIFITLEVIGK